MEIALYHCLVPLQSLNTLEQRAALIQGKLSDPRDSAEGRGEDDPAWNLNECILSSADTAISVESCSVPLSCLLPQRLPHPPRGLKEEMGSATIYKEHTQAVAREPPKQVVPPVPSIPSLSHLPKATLDLQNLGEEPIHPWARWKAPPTPHSARSKACWAAWWVRNNGHTVVRVRTCTGFQLPHLEPLLWAKAAASPLPLLLISTPDNHLPTELDGPRCLTTQQREPDHPPVQHTSAFVPQLLLADCWLRKTYWQWETDQQLGICSTCATFQEQLSIAMKATNICSVQMYTLENPKAAMLKFNVKNSKIGRMATEKPYQTIIQTIKRNFLIPKTTVMVN